MAGLTKRPDDWVYLAVPGATLTIAFLFILFCVISRVASAPGRNKQAHQQPAAPTARQTRRRRQPSMLVTNAGGLAEGEEDARQGDRVAAESDATAAGADAVDIEIQAQEGGGARLKHVDDQTEMLSGGIAMSPVSSVRALSEVWVVDEEDPFQEDGKRPQIDVVSLTGRKIIMGPGSVTPVASIAAAT